MSAYLVVLVNREFARFFTLEPVDLQSKSLRKSDS
jgi:hypothetical protein